MRQQLKATEAVVAHRWPLGVSTGIFPGTTISAEEYRLLGRHGVESVEIADRQASPALADRELRRRLVAATRDAGWPPVFSLHAPFKPNRDISVLDEELRRAAVAHAVQALDLAYELRAALVVLHASEEPLSESNRSDRLVQARTSLGSLVPEAKRLGIRLAVETMPPEWLPADVSEATDIAQGLDPEVVGFCLDTTHSNLKTDLPEIVRALGSRLWNVHMSDNDGLKPRHWMPFRGVIDWRAFLAALKAANYTGPLHYEVGPHVAGAERALQDIHENFYRLAALAAGT